MAAYTYVHTVYTCSETCLVRTLKGIQNQYLLSEVVLSGLVYVHEVYTLSQGQNDRGVLISRSMY